MLEQMLKEGYSIDEISEDIYNEVEGIEIKGKSNYDDSVIVDLLPEGQEFKIMEDSSIGYMDYYSYFFMIAFKYNEKYYAVADAG